MAKEKKVKEPEFYHSQINTMLRNYKVCYIKPIEKIVLFIAAFLVGGIVGLVFYGGLFKVDGEATVMTLISNLVVFCGVGFVAGKKFLEIEEKKRIERRQTALRNQFRELLSSLNSSFSAGANIALAFETAYRDMVEEFGSDSDIAKEVQEMNYETANNISIYSAMYNFAERSDLEDIKDFATIFEICYRKGGNIKEVVRNTYNLIGEKMSINDEIKTKLTSNKSQQTIMSIVPIFIIGFLKMSSSSFAANFASPTGVIVMTVAVGIFIGSYIYGRKIIDIKE